MEKIEVLRRQKLETREIMVGDQISIFLAGLGDFTATAHKITNKGVLFIFDEYVTSRPMNNQRTNEGGYEESDLKKWIDTVLLAAFPEELKSRIDNLSIPTVGELFGHDDEWNNEHFEPDEDDRLPLMKKRKNRVAYLNNNPSWFCLRNAVNRKYSLDLFAFVNGRGDVDYGHASRSHGVRPEFWLVR